MSTPAVAEYIPSVALVTGAAQGIGRAIALRLADDGINVAVNDIGKNADALAKVVQEIEQKGKKSISLVGDVSDETVVKSMVEKTVENLGSLDIMVANAGIAFVAPLLEMSMENFDRIVAVNLRGVMLCYKYAGIQMVKQGRGGRIIGAASVMGKKGCPQVSAYCATKFAVRGLTQSLSAELADHKITVNAYAPGIILTPMTDNVMDAGMGHGSATKKMLGQPPNGPDAEPEVVASFVSYLCKPEAYFINGQSVSVCGGVIMD